MTTNQFENSRVPEGTLQRGAQHAGSPPDENSPDHEISDMIAEGGPAPSRVGNSPAILRPDILRVCSAGTLLGDRVGNPEGEELGRIEEILLDIESGRIAYAVLSWSGCAGKHVPVPWCALQINQQLDQGEPQFILEMDRRTLESGPNFDRDGWPDMADPAFGRQIHTHFGKTPYWEHTPTDPARAGTVH
jgi:hypothetical protein